MLVRLIECTQGSVQVEAVCEPMFDYGEHAGAVGAVSTRTGPPPRRAHEEVKLRLVSDLRLGIEGNRVRARHTMVEGERRFVALGWSDGLEGPSDCPRRAGAGSTPPRTSGATGWRADASPTTAGARICSARR